MQFEDSVENFFTGERVSTGLSVRISGSEKCILCRLDVLENLVKDRKVIHVGCVDHLSVIDEKIRNNQWLHARLCHRASRCLGVDVNADGVRYLKEKLGYSDVICADMLSGTRVPEIESIRWDYMVMGEVLEHVDNPVQFLSALAGYSAFVDRLIVTVPHAFCLENLKSVFRHEEYINSDHRYWFTPYTLGKILTRAGFHGESFAFCQDYAVEAQSFMRKLRARASFRNFLLKRYPAFRNTLIMIARMKE